MKNLIKLRENFEKIYYVLSTAKKVVQRIFIFSLFLTRNK